MLTFKLIAMRYVNIKNIVLVLFSSLVMGACNKALDLNPQDQLSDANYWKSPADFKEYANQFYGWLRDFSGVISDGPHSDYRSDLMTDKTPNIYSNGTNTIPATDGNYTGAYSRIRTINTLLEHAHSYNDSASIAVSIAEAKFFRAYTYFDLLQLYGNAIIVKSVLNTTSPELSASRNSRDSVTDFIIRDLQEAIPALPLQSGIATADAGRVSRGAAQAFLSRVALYEGTWDKFRSLNTSKAQEYLKIAADAAKDVIDSKEYSLFEPVSLGDSAQKYMFILEDTKSNPAGLKKADNHEYILVKKHDEVIAPIGTNITKGQLANVVLVNGKFVNMYLCSDGLPIEKSPKFKGYSEFATEFESRDNRMRYTLLEPNKPYWSNAKYRITWNGDEADLANAASQAMVPTAGSGYQNQKWASERHVSDTYEGYDFPVIRYAEVLLNYAEAKFEQDEMISDADLNLSLNLVRLRVNKDMPELSNAFVSANGLDMRTEIRRERTIELYNEGFRVDDLKRWYTAGTEMPKNIIGIVWKGTQYEKAWSAAASMGTDTQGRLIIQSGRVWAEKNYLYPIPSDQLKLNKNLGQNDGWN